MRARSARIVLSALVVGGLLAPLTAASGAPSAAAVPGEVDLRVLSGRADLVSGGDALVELSLPAGAGAATVDVGGRDVTRAFVRLRDGRLRGLVTGLPLGASTLRAVLPDGRGARLRLTNHRSGGPLLAGRQVTPWVCDNAAGGNGPAQDAQCTTAPSYELRYRDVTANAFLPYDPAAPPPDAAVARTTTDRGVTVPYVVRLERGTQDRGNYVIAVLLDPAVPFTATAPQATWNGKLVVRFGSGSAPTHGSGEPGDPTGAADEEDLGGIRDDAALSRGFMVAASSLNVHGQNVNENVSAEALLMLKERIVERYGPIRYTLGNGCSGGGIQQYMLPAMYPGLVDGIQPNCSFEDFWTPVTEVMDCRLALRYFNEVAPQLWPVLPQRGAVDGHAPGSCEVWNAAFGEITEPSRAENCSLPAEQVYDAATNPRGVRCSAQDYQGSIWGPRPKAVWGPVERQLGRGFAGKPIDNVGVQYGLEAFDEGLITAEQFVDLNARIGGLDIDHAYVPGRMEADAETLRTAYRTGQITDARQLAGVPIIDLRGYSEVGEVHTSYHSYGMRARLDQRNGTHANQLIWTFSPVAPIVTVPTGDVATDAFLVLDRWLTAIEADTSDRPLAQKVVAHKPADATDRCIVGGRQVSTSPTCDGATPPFDDARGVAGRPATNDVVKCRLKALDPGDYATALTPAQLQSLRAAFPRGVCDWSVPGVGQQPAVPWLTFAAGPGGQPLGAAPTAVAFSRAAATPVAAAPGGSTVAVPSGRLPATGAPALLPWLALGLVCAGVVRTRRWRTA